MIRGIVHDLQARVNVVFRLPGRPDLSIECVVDTGFEGALALPPAAVAAMGLVFFQEIDANLANGLDVKTDVYIGRILWDGGEFDAAVLAMGHRPLLGTALLNGKRFFANFVDGGEVRVEPSS